VRSKAPIAQNPADGVLLFHGKKWLDEVEDYCQQALVWFGGCLMHEIVRPMQRKIVLLI